MSLLPNVGYNLCKLLSVLSNMITITLTSLILFILLSDMVIDLVFFEYVTGQNPKTTKQHVYWTKGWKRDSNVELTSTR